VSVHIKLLLKSCWNNIYHFM